MCLTFPAETGAANNSPSLRNFPYENFVTNISISPLYLYCPFRARGRGVQNGKRKVSFTSVYGSQRGTKPKSLRGYKAKPYKHSKRAEQEIFLARLLYFYLIVLSDDLRTLTSTRIYANLCRPKRLIQSIMKAEINRKTFMKCFPIRKTIPLIYCSTAFLAITAATQKLSNRQCQYQIKKTIFCLSLLYNLFL